MPKTATRTMAKADWREAEAMAMRGTSLAEIARRFDIRHATVRQRASRCDWQTPDRIARKQRLAARLVKQGVIPASPGTVTEAPEPSPKGEAKGDGLASLWGALLSAAEGGDPVEFQQALKGLTRSIIAKGASNISAPRTINELRTMVDVLAKAENLTRNAPGQGRVSFRVPRSIGRPTIKRPAEAATGAADPPHFEI